MQRCLRSGSARVYQRVTRVSLLYVRINRFSRLPTSAPTYCAAFRAFRSRCFSPLPLFCLRLKTRFTRLRGTPGCYWFCHFSDARAVHSTPALSRLLTHRSRTHSCLPNALCCGCARSFRLHRRLRLLTRDAHTATPLTVVLRRHLPCHLVPTVISRIHAACVLNACAIPDVHARGAPTIVPVLVNGSSLLPGSR